jgi:hypothetical protein
LARQRRRQVDLDFVLGKDERALNAILQFAHVARPRVGLDVAQRLLRQALRSPGFFVQLVEQMARQ